MGYKKNEEKKTGTKRKLTMYMHPEPSREISNICTLQMQKSFLLRKRYRSPTWTKAQIPTKLHVSTLKINPSHLDQYLLSSKMSIERKKIYQKLYTKYLVFLFLVAIRLPETEPKILTNDSIDSVVVIVEMD